ncbi:MAG TPA: hypothetical protein VJQ54_21610, partial [Candidatus Sulfotelmatobacter sp.]|nr:hypothetical protein [Candidatus Sulfotelmatobacter sp.]
MKPTIHLDHILESAIVVSWPDLSRGTHAGLVHIEYAFAPTGTLDYMKVWMSISRGHWLLACEYWMSANTFHGVGVRFENGYQSEELARILEFVMQHQDSFVPPANLGRQGLLQIPTPTEQESTDAAITVNEAIHSSQLA